MDEVKIIVYIRRKRRKETLSPEESEWKIDLNLKVTFFISTIKMEGNELERKESQTDNYHNLHPRPAAAEWNSLFGGNFSVQIARLINLFSLLCELIFLWSLPETVEL